MTRRAKEAKAVHLQRKLARLPPKAEGLGSPAAGTALSADDRLLSAEELDDSGVF